MMFRRSVAGIAILTLATPTSAQPKPDVAVPLTAAEGYGPCSTANVINLPKGRRLAVRAGPSSRARILAHLGIGAAVFACVRRGDWFGIVYGRDDCGVIEPRRRSSSYRGPCASGWVHYDYLGGYADFVSP